MMKTWLLRSSSIVLSASLLIPATYAYAESPAASASQAVSPGIQGKGAVAAAAASKVKLDKEAALTLAKKMVPATGLTLSNVSFRSADPWRTFPEWTFSWVKKMANSEETAIAYSVGIHANTGELTSFSHYEKEDGNFPYAKRISYEDARKQAERFLNKYNPGKAAETKLYVRDMPAPKTPLNNDFIYAFRFVRMEDGVLFPDNGVNISVNGNGTINNYSLNWDDVEFNKPGKQISAEEAKERLINEAKAKPSYILPWEAQGDKQNKPMLAYENPFSFYIDASDGKALTLSLANRNGVQEPVAVSPKALPARHTGGSMTQEEVVKLASNIFDLSGFELQSANYNDNDYRGNRPVWNLEYRQKEKSDNGYAFVSIDAKTGDVYSFSKDKWIMKEKQASVKKMDSGALLQKAVESIRKWSPALASQLYYTDLSDDEGMNRFETDPSQVFRFKRYVDGISAASGSASVRFNSQTGEILSYQYDIGGETYPTKPPKALPAETAVQSWWKEAEAEELYVLVPPSAEEQAKMRQQPSYVPKKKAKLVYRASVTPFDHTFFLDAVSGEWRSQASGKVIQLHRAMPSDLQGHPAEKELLVMYEYDALSLIDGKIMPEKAITRGEMIEMLMISLNQGRFFPTYSMERKATFQDVANGSRYFSAVEAAVDRGLLDKSASKLNPDEPITRDELADMIARALGYSNLASYSDMFQSKLTDIANAKHRGAIVIASTLGIMPTANDKFQPQLTVSREDAAITFTHFLEKRGDQSARPVPYRFAD